MIKYYYRNLKSKQLSQIDEYQAGCWIYVQKPTQPEIEYLAKRFKLDEGHLTDANDPDEMPRLEKEGSETYLFVRYAHMAIHNELTTTPLLFIIGQKWIMTVAHTDLPRESRFLGGQLNFATTQRTKLLLLMLSELLEQYDGYINAIGRRINAIRTRFKGSKVSNQDLISFALIEDELNDLLSALKPTRAILSRLLVGRHVQLFDEDQDLVEDLVLKNEQAIESLLSNIRSISSIREAYSTISSNNLNRTMKTLTAVTVFLALPNVIFSMYGMNVPLPFQTEPWAYTAVVAASVVVVVLVYLIARKRRIF